MAQRKKRGSKKHGRGSNMHRLSPMDKHTLKKAALDQLGKNIPTMQEVIEENAVEEDYEAEILARGDIAPKEGYKQRVRERKKVARTRIKKRKKATKPKRKIDGKRLALMLFGGAVVGGLLLASWFAFLLREVTVSGNEQYATVDIVSLTGLEYGEHLLLVDLEDAQLGIEQNPYLKVVDIERRWPRAVHITIEERKEAAVIRTNEYDVVIDREGHVLSIGSGGDFSDIIKLTGVLSGGFQVNRPIGDSADFATQTLLTILEKIEEYDLLADITSADVSNLLSVTLTTSEGIRVLLGEGEELDEKFEWIKATLPSLRDSGVVGGFLDVTAKGGAVYSPPGIAQQAQEASDAAEENDVIEPQGDEGETDDTANGEIDGETDDITDDNGDGDTDEAEGDDSLGDEEPTNAVYPD